MKQSEINELATTELVDCLDNNVAALNKLKMNHAVSPVDNPMQIRRLRRTVARLKTELNVRTIKELNK